MLKLSIAVLLTVIYSAKVLSSEICRHPDWDYEHVVPVSTLAITFSCSEDCLVNKRFMAAYSDLHNTLVVPLSCTETQRLPIPFNRELRGAMARIYFYMIDQHRLTVDQDYYTLLLQWSHIYPVMEWERERNQILTEMTGRSNYYVN